MTPAPERPDLSERLAAIPNPPSLEREAYDAGRLAGFEEGIEAATVTHRAAAPVTDAALSVAPERPDLAAAVHGWNEANIEGGCVHFDKGFGPYAACEDPDNTVPIDALPTICAAPVTDAGLREALDEMDRLASFGNGITSSAYRYCADLLRAALSRQAERPYLTSGEQRRLACVCGHPLIRHTEYGCIDCGTSEATSPQHNFTRTSRQAEKETA
jgi:hypothetical protein